MAITLEKVLEDARTAEVLLNSLLGIKVPKTLKHAIRAEWAETAQSGAEDFLAHVGAHVIGRTKQRVIPIARANEILATLEDAVVGMMADYDVSPIMSIYRRVAGRTAWLIGHTGIIIIALQPLIAEAVKIVAAAPNTIGDWFSWNAAAFEYQQAGQMDKAAEALNQGNKEANEIIRKVKELAVFVVGTIFAHCVAEAVGAAATGVALKKVTVPVKRLRDAAIYAAERFAFPQSQKGRVRRRKLSR